MTCQLKRYGYIDPELYDIKDPEKIPEFLELKRYILVCPKLIDGLQIAKYILKDTDNYCTLLEGEYDFSHNGIPYEMYEELKPEFVNQVKTNGTSNIGNTCYLNAFISILWHIPELRFVFLSDGAFYDTFIDKFGEYLEFFEQLMRDVDIGLTENLTKYVTNTNIWPPLLNYPNQQDASELANFLLDKLDTLQDFRIGKRGHRDRMSLFPETFGTDNPMHVNLNNFLKLGSFDYRRMFTIIIREENTPRFPDQELAKLKFKASIKYSYSNLLTLGIPSIIQLAKILGIEDIDFTSVLTDAQIERFSEFKQLETQLKTLKDQIIPPETLPTHIEMRHLLTHYQSLERLPDRIDFYQSDDDNSDFPYSMPNNKQTNIFFTATYLIIVPNRYKFKTVIVDTKPEQTKLYSTEKINIVITDWQYISVNGKTYECVGIVYHLGISPKGGHYVADVKVSGKWYHFNDSSDPVETFPTDSADSYLFLYRQVFLEGTVYKSYPYIVAKINRKIIDYLSNMLGTKMLDSKT